LIEGFIGQLSLPQYRSLIALSLSARQSVSLSPVPNNMCVLPTDMSLLHTASICCLIATASLLQTSNSDTTHDIANTLLGELQAGCLTTLH